MDLIYKTNTKSAQCFISSESNISLYCFSNNECKLPDTYRRSIVFANHIGNNAKMPEFVKELIKNDIGVVYVCDKIPSHPCIDNKISYLLVSWGDFRYDIFSKANLFNYVGFYGDSAYKIAQKFSKAYDIRLF